MVFIVFFDQKLPMFKNESFDLPYVMRRHAIIACQPYRRKPKLAFGIRAAPKALELQPRKLSESQKRTPGVTKKVAPR
jgi:hypothetical protein